MELLYLDNSLAVCVKPAGALSTDAPGGAPDLLRQTLGDPDAEVRTVHRLDRVVGGVMLLARSAPAAAALGKQVMDGRFQKRYLAVVHGAPDHAEGTFTDLLRRDMGFEGLVMADDFRMNGLRSKSSLEEAAVQFIRAGGDLVLCGANHSYQLSILKGLTEAVADGTISQERLNESVVRVLTAKMKVTDWMP